MGESCLDQQAVLGRLQLWIGGSLGESCPGSTFGWQVVSEHAATWGESCLDQQASLGMQQPREDRAESKEGNLEKVPLLCE